MAKLKDKWVILALGVQLFQKSWNFMLSTHRLYSLVLVIKGFVQDLPSYLSENLSAFSLPSKTAIIARFGCLRNFKPKDFALIGWQNL